MKMQGFTLLEMLTAMLLFSMAMLGLAQLCFNSLEHTHSIHYRSIARRELDNLQATMAAHRINGSWQHQADDIAQWQNEIQAILPRGRGELTVNDADYLAKLQWQEGHDEINTLSLQILG